MTTGAKIRSSTGNYCDDYVSNRDCFIDHLDCVRARVNFNMEAIPYLFGCGLLCNTQLSWRYYHDSGEIGSLGLTINFYRHYILNTLEGHPVLRPGGL